MEYKKYVPIFLRISLSLVFLWFGYANIFNYEIFLKYIPSFVYSLPLSLREVLFINGVFDIVFGLFLLVGFYTRISALLLSFQILAITYFVGYNGATIGNIGLFLATISIFINGFDEWCIDKKLKSRKLNF